MLFLAISWGMLFVASFLLGAMALQSIGAASIGRDGDRLMLALWIGLIGLAWLLLALSLILPVSPVVGISVFLSIIVISLIHQQARVEAARIFKNISLKLLCVAIVLFILTAFISTQPIIYYDTGLYHFQIVRWLSRYGAVPGLTLIHGRFGFVSAWFALAAPFHGGVFETKIGGLTGGFALYLALLHLLVWLNRIISRRALFSDWFGLLSMLLCLPYAVGIGLSLSHSPDLPVILLVIVTSWSMLIISACCVKHPCHSSRYILIIPLTLSIGALLMKLSALPLFVVSFFFWLFGLGKARLSHLLVGLGGLFIGYFPILTGSLISSGCLVYPLPALCFDLPWSIGTDKALEMTELIQNYSKWNSYNDVTDNSLRWLWLWAKRDIEIWILLVSSAISFIYIKCKSTFKEIDGLNWVIAIGIAGIIYIIMAAPSGKFGLGYFVLLPALFAPAYPNAIYPLILIAALTPDADFHTRPLRFFVLMFAIISYLSSLYALTKRRVKNIGLISLCVLSLFILKALIATLLSEVVAGQYDKLHLLAPPEMHTLNESEFVQKRINDINYIVPVKSVSRDQCFAAELPCTPDLTHENIRLRDPKRGIRAGFVRID